MGMIKCHNFWIFTITGSDKFETVTNASIVYDVRGLRLCNSQLKPDCIRQWPMTIICTRHAHYIAWQIWKSGGPSRSIAMASNCVGCSPVFFEVIHRYWRNDSDSLTFLEEHGVIKSSHECPRCKNKCILREDRQMWVCTHYSHPAKKKTRKYCSYSICRFHGSFLTSRQ